MALGTPTVATSMAAAALQALPGKDYLVADEAGDFANSVIELLTYPGKSRSIAENARRYVEEHHDWKLIGQQLQMIYQEVCP